MKICQLCAVDFTLKKFLLPLIDGLVANGDEVISVCSSGEYVQEMRADGYQIDTISISRSLQPLKHMVSIWKLYRYFQRESFDIVHVHTPLAALVGRIAAHFARVPCVIYTAHGFYFHDRMPSLKKRVHVVLERLAGKMTDLLFTQSNEDAVTARELKIMPRDRIFAIGNGVDPTRFDPARYSETSRTRKSLSIPEWAFVVGMVGRQVEEKGVVEFLEAATQLADLYPRLYFLLVGDRLVSDHAVTVNKLVKESKKTIGDRLILTGMRSDIPELLSAMDVFTLPSWREGLPRTIIEAMMMELPVVATDIRGSREEVVPEITGLLVPVQDHTELARAIERFVQNPKWGKDLGLSGRERALEMYDEEKVVGLQIKLIGQFLAGQL